jgi:nucleotide-binding universal stress UspA family protein
VADFELGTDGPTAILVGVDGSTTASRAGWYAAGLARRQRARLIVVYVSPMATASSAVPGGATLAAAENEARDEMAEDMRRRADDMSKELGIHITFMVATGSPFREIVRLAGETKADAIVVGASTKAGHRFVGSLAVHLVRLGKWPVTVVP